MAGGANHILLLVTALVCGAAAVCVSSDAIAAGETNQTHPQVVSTAESFPVASDVRIAGDAKQTRFILDLDKKIDLRAFTLGNPYRVVIDIPQVTFHLPADAGAKGRGLIKAFRYGLVMLRARLYEIELKKREEQAAADQAAKTDIGWGHQIRSYVLQPYQMVKDLRTGVQTSDTSGVLDGDLDEFMAATLAQKAFGTSPGAVEDVD